MSDFDLSVACYNERRYCSLCQTQRCHQFTADITPLTLHFTGWAKTRHVLKVSIMAQKRVPCVLLFASAAC